jgi:hypothetical protein
MLVAPTVYSSLYTAFRESPHNILKGMLGPLPSHPV